MEVLERFLSNISAIASVASKGPECFWLCACGWLLGPGPPLLLGVISCGSEKSTIRKHPVSAMQKESGERWGLGVRSRPADTVIPVVQNSTVFYNSNPGRCFLFLSTFLPWGWQGLSAPLGLTPAGACGLQELVSRWPCPVPWGCKVLVDGLEISWNSRSSWNDKRSSWKSGLPLPSFLKKPTFYFLLHSLHSSF